MTYVTKMSKPIRGLKSRSLICEDKVYESVWKGVSWRLTLDTYWLIHIRPFLKYG